MKRTKRRVPEKFYNNPYEEVGGNHIDLTSVAISWSLLVGLVITFAVLAYISYFS